MAAIVLKSFGGMMPAANPKAMPEAAGVFVKNLDLRHGDFRPRPVPASLGLTVAAGQTLYRFESTGSFITSTSAVNFVRGPIPTDTTERTYYTGDGAPKVRTAAGDVRQLGVPAPSNAPAVTVNTSDEFSTEESQASQAGKLYEAGQAMWSNLVQSHTGLEDAEIAALGFVATSDPWRFRYAIAGTLSGTAFTPANPAHRALMSDKLNFYYETVGLTTTGYVDVSLRAMKYSFDPTFSADLQAITAPDNPANFLIPAAQADAIVGALAQPLTDMGADRLERIAKLRLLAQEFSRIAGEDSPALASGAGAVGEFYADPGIDDVIEKSYADVSKLVYDAIQTYNEP